MLSYLKDFNKRMNSIVIPYKLTQYCKNNVKTYRKNRVSDELFFLLIHYVLLFVEECNIRQKFCTKDSVVEELKKICEDIGIEVNLYELASDIINHCCENDGNRLVFDAQMHKETIQPFEIHLIDGKYEYREGRYVTGYELTPQCLDYIYATKEIAEIGRVSIEQIKLEKAIKAGNFQEARSNVDNLIMAIESQKKSFKIKERMVLTNILMLEVSEVMKDITDALNMIHSQRNDSVSIKKLLDAQAKASQKEEALKHKEMESGILDIYYVKDRLNYILGLQMNLISTLQDFLFKFKEELVSADFITERASINILEDIIKPLEEDIKGVVDPFQVLIPLLHLSKSNKFNLNAIFSEQAIMKEKEDNDVEIEEVNMEDSLFDNTVQILQNNERYEELFLIILREVSKKDRVSLAEIVKASPAFGNNANATKVVLTSLLYEREIVFDNLNRFRSAGDLEVFFPEILHEEGGISLMNKRLVIETDHTEEVIMEEIDEGTQIKTMIKVPNMYFQFVDVEEN